MSLPTGLVPVYAFVLTLGVSVPTTVVAVLFHRTSDVSFGGALRTALVAAGGLYVVGIAIVWAVTGGGSLWGVTAALVVTGIVASVVLVAVPLAVGRRVFGLVRPTDAELALEYATYGWPLAMLVAFGVFLAPGGVARGHLFSLDGTQVCLAGFCGIAVSLVVAVVIELVVVALGPGLFGLSLHFLGTSTEDRQARS